MYFYEHFWKIYDILIIMSFIYNKDKINVKRNNLIKLHIANKFCFVKFYKVSNANY